jgi:hypothetical protein
MVTSHVRSRARGALLAHTASKAPIAALVLIAGVAALSGSASARTKPVDLRVLNTAGRTLAEQRQYAGTVRIKTDRHATCFGKDTGGSGKRMRVPGATALGAVRDALRWQHGLRPLSITDAFADQGFGLGVCGIGGYRAQGSSFWYLKAAHAGSQVSGSEFRVHAGEEVLWYLTPSFPPPGELALAAPARARPGAPLTVKVLSYADDGTRSPAAGVHVTGAAAPTDSSGHATVTLTRSGTRTLRATRSPDIPSNRVTVCVNADLSRCPAAHGKLIFGSGAGDRIHDTRGWDRIKAGSGPDAVNLRRGGRDRVNCGRGRDRVIERRSDHDNRIASNCERVVRR